MSTAELKLRSRLWQILVGERSPNLQVSELMATCRAQVDDEELAPYFAPGAEDLFRHFVRGEIRYFVYDTDQDTVAAANDSPNAVMDQWLVRYLALRIQGGLDSERELFSTCLRSVVPECIIDHLMSIYNGSLEMFVKAHWRDFTIEVNGSIWMTLTFRRKNVVASMRERNLVLFFVDLLQKIGARRGDPCGVRKLRLYLPFMSSDERSLLAVDYLENLNAFFLLYPYNFSTTASDNESVFLRNYDYNYSEALYLKQHLQAGFKRKITMIELTLRAKYSLSLVVPFLAGTKITVGRVKGIVQRHPAIFFSDVQANEVWLRQDRDFLLGGGRNAETELLCVAYFIDVLKYIGATSPSRAICFNYMLHAVRAAPPECRHYLENVHPALEVIDLFHMHPCIFDLPSVNRVCFKSTPVTLSAAGTDDDGEELKGDNAEEQAVDYVAKLLKYACDLNPDLLAVCVETAPVGVRNYCMASEVNRLQSIVESAKATLPEQEAQFSSPVSLNVCAKTTSDASIQTGGEPVPQPVMCEPGKEEFTTRSNENIYEAEGQKACGFVMPGNMDAKESLLNAVAVPEVPAVEALPECVISGAPPTKTFDKGEPSSSGLSEANHDAKHSQGAVLYAVLDRISAMESVELDSEAKSQLTEAAKVKGSSERANEISLVEPKVTGFEEVFGSRVRRATSPDGWVK